MQVQEDSQPLYKSQDHQKRVNYSKDHEIHLSQQSTASIHNLKNKKKQLSPKKHQQKAIQNEIQYDEDEQQQQYQQYYDNGQNQNQINEILKIKLQYKETIWFYGEIVASNRQVRQVIQVKWGKIKQIFNFRISPIKLCNNDQSIAYYCIRRQFGGGKILYLQKKTYKQKFLINLFHLLTINYDLSQCKVETVNQIPYLSKIGSEDEVQLSYRLQASLGNTIYQKSLQKNEKMYLYDGMILAMSESIIITTKEHEICLEGPGIIFFEAFTPNLEIISKRNNIVFILLFIICIFIFYFVAAVIQ